MEARRSLYVLLSLLVLTVATTGVSSLEYTINTTWNNQPVDHKTPVKLTLSGSTDGQYLNLDIVAPFFNDPPAPPGPPGKAFFGLWEFEVVEAFFLNDQNQYVEIEVCPWGQHIVLLLSGQRVTIRHSLPLEVDVLRSANTWTGTAKIPVSYLPKAVTKFNAYAIHGSGDARVYESLYPADGNATAPDFHALQHFKPIDLSSLLPDQATAPISQLWTDSLEGLFRYQITKTWDSDALSTPPVEITLQGFEDGVEMNVTAPFYNDLAPDGPAGKPFYGLWHFEVVEMFFLNNNEEYLELELGPWGQHLLLLLKGERNTIKHSLSLDYIATRTMPTEVGGLGEWKGSAMIPPGYFPPNVSHMNAYAIHGVDKARKYQALYPAPKNNPNYSEPDFHKLDLFQPIDFEYQVKDNSQYSKVWQDAIDSGSTTVAPRPEAEEEVAALTVLGPVEVTPEPTITILPPTTPQPTTYEATTLETITLEPTTMIPTTLPEEVETQTALSIDESLQRVPPKPQKIDLSQFRVQRLEEKEPVPPQFVIEPAVVPTPELIVIQRTPSRVFGSQRVIQRGSQRFSLQHPSGQNQKSRKQQQSQQLSGQRRRPQNGSPVQPNQQSPLLNHQEDQRFHDQRQTQGQAFQRGQGQFKRRRPSQDQSSHGSQGQLLSESQLLHRGQGQFHNQRLSPSQVFQGNQEQFHDQNVPQDQSFHNGQVPFQDNSQSQRQHLHGGQEHFQDNSQPQGQQGHFQDHTQTQRESFQGQFQAQGQPGSQSFHSQDEVHIQLDPEIHFHDQQGSETSVAGSGGFISPDIQAQREAEQAADLAARREAELAAREAELAAREAELEARREEAARREAELVARREEAARREAELVARREEAARREAELAVRKEAAEQAARNEAELAVRIEAELVARREEEARREAELAVRKEAAKQAADLAARSEAELAVRREAELVARREEEARREAELAVRREAAEQAADLASRSEAELAARREAELVARREEEARREAELAVRREAAEQAADLAARSEAELFARKEAELVARREEEARREAELAVRREAAEQAADLAARSEAELAARREAELVARREEAARREAELAVRREAELAEQREAELAAQREAETLVSLVGQGPPLPPAHPHCFQPGLIPDEDSCWVFHECVLEDGAWEMYSWKCMRGHVYDPVSVSCVRGRCRRRG